MYLYLQNEWKKPIKETKTQLEIKSKKLIRNIHIILKIVVPQLYHKILATIFRITLSTYISREHIKLEYPLHHLHVCEFSQHLPVLIQQRFYLSCLASNILMLLQFLGVRRKLIKFCSFCEVKFIVIELELLCSRNLIFSTREKSTEQKSEIWLKVIRIHKIESILVFLR